MARIRYVNPASVGGDGTTQALVGATAAYASLSAGEAAEQIIDSDLTNDTTITIDGLEYALIFRCAGSADTTTCQINGYSTDSTHRLLVEADDDSPPGGDGWNQGPTFSTAFYYLELFGTAGQALNVNDDFVTVSRIQFRHSGTSTNDEVVSFGSVSGNTEFIMMQCRWDSNTAQLGSKALQIVDTQAVSKIQSCVFDWAIHGGADAAAIYISAMTQVDIENCTISQGTDGIRSEAPSGTLNILNSAVFDCTDDIDIAVAGPTVTVTNTVTDDDLTLDANITTLTNVERYGIGGFDTSADCFTNKAGGDFTLKTGCSMIDAGTTGGPSVDLIGVSFGATAEMGGFAFVAAAAGNPWLHYRQSRVA